MLTYFLWRMGKGGEGGGKNPVQQNDLCISCPEQFPVDPAEGRGKGTPIKGIVLHCATIHLKPSFDPSFD
eukprot:5295020-Amphidinium_carterae.1